MDHIESILQSLEQVRCVDKKAFSLYSSDICRSTSSSSQYPSMSSIHQMCMDCVKEEEEGSLSSLQSHIENFKSLYPSKSSCDFMIHRRQVNGKGRTILQEACAHGNINCVEWILTDATEEDEYYKEHENRHPQTTKRINVNQTSLIGQETALHIACFHGYDSIVSLLLNHGADPHLCNVHGKTCMEYEYFQSRNVK